jgi:phospholipid/cholesterol/gamma-HCH transport system substrate-binding protein
MFADMDVAAKRFTEDQDETGLTTADHVHRAAKRIDEFTQDMYREDKDHHNTLFYIQKAAKGMGSLTTDLDRFTGDLYRDLYEKKDETGRTTVEHMSRAAKGWDDMVNDHNGSLFQMVHNPDLYNNLNRAAGNINDLTVQFQPIVHDMRVFSDKIARHPETLGVRGAIKPSLGNKGVPSFASPGGYSDSPDDPSLAPSPDGQPWRLSR